MHIILDGGFCFSEAPWLSWQDIKYGLNQGFLNPAGVVEYAVKGLSDDSCAEHYELACLTGDNVNDVQECLDKLAALKEENIEGLEGVWLFLILLWVFQNRGSYQDPLGVVEELYADFNYPESISSIVRYMPAESLNSDGEARIFENWADLLISFRRGFEASRSRGSS